MTIDKKYYLDGTEKVGDKVWRLDKWIQCGYGECLIEVFNDYNDIYPIRVDGLTYTSLGLFSRENKNPSLFKSNPFIPEFPKMMEVSDDDTIWKKELVYSINGVNLLYPIVSTGIMYKYAREIQAKPKLSEILKEKGIDISNFENDL